MKKIAILFVTLLYVTQSLFGCCGNNKENDKTVNIKNQYEDACNTPFGKYPETVTYTLGKMTGANNSNMPEGDTYENNAYTRYLNKKLNIQNVDMFESPDPTYNDMAILAISEKKIPDVMIIDDYEYLKLLVENDMIEDLTDVYKKCTSERIKDIYSGYGSEIFNTVTFDGRLMALPETNIDHGPNMLWLRKDWMDKLGLEPPKTLKDAEYIISQFVEKDPGGNGKGNTIGLACSTNLTSQQGYSYMNEADIIFANYNAYPKQWIENENGEAVYGSVCKEAKDALAHMNELYEKQILDNQFLLRAQNNIEDLIIDGKCGSFFGLWWAPNNPLMKSVIKDNNANWQPYMISTNQDGSTSFCTQNPSCKYIVVRKGYEHPEIIMKYVSVLFDYFNYNDQEVIEMKNYYRDNVDQTARPLVINVDYKDALIKCYKDITAALNCEKKKDTLQLLEYSYYEQCKKYLEDPENASPEDWAAYTSRIKASSLLVNSDLKRVKAVFYDKQTESMTKNWWKLEELEKQAYFKIITGEEPIDYFDKFVEDWYEQGGKQITEEVRMDIKSNQESKTNN